MAKQNIRGRPVGRLSRLAVAEVVVPMVAPVFDWRPPVEDRHYSEK